MLGDGGIADNQISVTLGYTTNSAYIPYVIKLIKKLFNTKASLYKHLHKDAINIRVSGINLVQNLVNIGLVKGNKIKQQFDIPFGSEKKTYI